MSKTEDQSFSSIKPIFGLRHPASGLLHLLGVLLAVIGLIWLVWIVKTSHGPGAFWKYLSVAVFCGSMFLLYSASSLYHLLNVSERVTQVLKKLDHSMIFLFIAGSYTPFCLVLFRDGKMGWPLFAVIWAVALTGIILKLFGIGKSRYLRVGIYLLMGWISVIIIPEIWRALSVGGFTWLLLGGAAYTGGAVIYALRRPNPFPRHFGFHEIWHSFVLLGSVCHFWMMKQYVIPFQG